MISWYFEREMQNQSFRNYSVQSFFLPKCGMKQPIDFATSQPNVFFKGSHTVGLGGCNVDNDSNLKLGTIQTNPKCRISLQQRPFNSSIFRKRSCRPVEESNYYRVHTREIKKLKLLEKLLESIKI